MLAAQGMCLSARLSVACHDTLPCLSVCMSVCDLRRHPLMTGAWRVRVPGRPPTRWCACLLASAASMHDGAASPLATEVRRLCICPPTYYLPSTPVHLSVWLIAGAQRSGQLHLRAAAQHHAGQPNAGGAPVGGRHAHSAASARRRVTQVRGVRSKQAASFAWSSPVCLSVHASIRPSVHPVFCLPSYWLPLKGSHLLPGTRLEARRH
jgi:hypothetical protein